MGNCICVSINTSRSIKTRVITLCEILCTYFLIPQFLNVRSFFLNFHFVYTQNK